MDRIKYCTLTKNLLTVVMHEGYPLDLPLNHVIYIYIDIDPKFIQEPYPDYYIGFDYMGNLDRLEKNSSGDWCAFFEFDRDYNQGEIIEISVDTQYAD